MLLKSIFLVEKRIRQRHLVVDSLAATCILCLMTSTGTRIKHELTSPNEADSIWTSTGFSTIFGKIDALTDDNRLIISHQNFTQI